MKRTVRTYGASLIGHQAELITVEGRFEAIDKQRTEVVITGLPDAVLRESRGRLLSALNVNGLRLGCGRLYLNLVPAARRKSGEGLDLALALAAAGAGAHLDPKQVEDTLFLGEVGIDGKLHDVAGGLAAALAARAAGVHCVIAPPATAREAACLEELEVREAGHLADVVGHLARGGQGLPMAAPPADLPLRTGYELLNQVRGQAGAVYSLGLAAVGGHALLLIGPPGVGKTLLARCLPELLEAPRREERLEMTAVLSAAGRWPGGLVDRRPFRAPHHTASHVGLVGGGNDLRPGEISLAHRGVLFLDELPEFSRESLESLRQPLESGRMTISRAGRQLELPAQFQLVAAMNPCPCGYLGHGSLPCTCAPRSVQRYRQRISGPLLDRIDLRSEVATPSVAELTTAPAEEPPHGNFGEHLDRARSLRTQRGQTRLNAELRGPELDAFVPFDGASTRLLARAAQQRSLSPRAIASLRRVARSVADWDGSEAIERQHWATALQVRAPVLEGT